ncbi:hypothetical protein BFP72_07470 [Reichenbachiella sp. 5M10]|uniref:hypothetical protein n=1 Tax=Reichenbachiella sp. 5M10 TaxID=1889772 RepID=UPI000C14EAD3|nr:hypothetical protein [Reichenbachiella sp. 5M10]PIB35245.1 hypothetical protein BFP72_07470 [Reichenbachiella sp. 5M10]
MKALHCLLWILATLPVSAAQVVDFTQADDSLQVYQGQTVHVQADGAWVISMQRAALLNQKLQELQTVSAAHAELMQTNQEILDKVREIERLTAQLVHKIERDQRDIALNMSLIIAELDRSIVVLQTTNTELQSTNEQLNQQLAEMERTVKHLKKQIRRIWWKSTADKIIIGLAAFGVGWAIGNW